jgi:hypothetical protein
VTALHIPIPTREDLDTIQRDTPISLLLDLSSVNLIFSRRRELLSQGTGQGQLLAAYPFLFWKRVASGPFSISLGPRL